MLLALTGTSFGNSVRFYTFAKQETDMASALVEKLLKNGTDKASIAAVKRAGK